VGRIISTLPDIDSNRALLHSLYEHRYGGEIVAVAAVDFAVENLVTAMRSDRTTRTDV
jgi:hypothetical protein